jgi:hypothetical protein
MKVTTMRRTAILLAPVASAGLVWGLVPGAQGATRGTNAATAPAAAAIPPQQDDPSLLTKVTDCELTKTDMVVQENPIDSTTNQSPITPTQVKGMTKTVTVGGSGPNCVVVHVAAVAYAQRPADQPYDSMNLSVWMDGHVGHPAEYQFAADDDQLGGTHAAIFVFTKVNPGVHTFSLKFWTALGGKSTLGVPTMQIMHR